MSPPPVDPEELAATIAANKAHENSSIAAAERLLARPISAKELSQELEDRFWKGMEGGWVLHKRYSEIPPAKRGQS
jgi:hypothetical protein